MNLMTFLTGIIILNILIIITFLFWGRRSYGKGRRGEFLTCRELERLHGAKRILRNAYLPLSGNRTTEADLILINTHGIFVIEHKDYSGSVAGSDDDYNWMHTVGGQTYRFYNPIRQNDTHINRLMALLPDIPAERFQSLIVFSNRCNLDRLKRLRPSRYTTVLHRSKLRKTIRRYNRWHSSVFTEEQVDSIYETLLPYTNAGRSVRKRHVRDLQRRYSEKY